MSTQKQPLNTLPGSPLPLGSSRRGDHVNFAIYARHACSVILVMVLEETFTPQAETREIVLDPEINRTGDVWHVALELGSRMLRYGYRIDGTPNPAEGILFFPERVLLDPYCTRIVPRPWGAESYYGKVPLCLAGTNEDFDWQGDRPLTRPASETIIYELHVRGFTRHHSSRVSAPGTYRGIIEKIPYLKELGITAVELLPINEWDETDNKFYHPETGELLLNYWGYNPLSFFALKSGFAAAPAEHINEFKTMVRSLHQAGIEVILDMVFNHTGETDHDGTTSGFRGIDNATYYMIDGQNGDYHNFTGCGNTVDCNHPVVREIILESLRYLVREMHVDGFRFDLASIFSRNSDGEILASAPLVDLIAVDPVLRDTKIIAEAWDAAGLYQVGSFSNNPRWVEWNGRYRDDIRKFMAGYPDSVHNLATRIAGSSDLYQSHGRSPLNSVNFITCHDGFTLYDLVSYDEKSNLANGEQNRDGEAHNLSWNSGHEGDPCPEKIAELRERRMRTFTALLLLSQGIPMITAGDEVGRSQRGNNNGWCQDNALSWLDWGLMQRNESLLRFFRECIDLRKKHPLFRRDVFFNPAHDTDGRQSPEITWQSLVPGQPDWSADCRTLAFLLRSSGISSQNGSDFYIMVNGARNESAEFMVPDLPESSGLRTWRCIVDTGAASPLDIVALDQAISAAPGSVINVAAMALVMLQSHDDSRQQAHRSAKD